MLVLLHDSFRLAEDEEVVEAEVRVRILDLVQVVDLALERVSVVALEERVEQRVLLRHLGDVRVINGLLVHESALVLLVPYLRREAEKRVAHAAFPRIDTIRLRRVQLNVIRGCLPTRPRQRIPVHVTLSCRGRHFEVDLLKVNSSSIDCHLLV